MNRQITAIAALLGLGAIFYLATTLAHKKEVVNHVLPPPGGERTYAIAMQSTIIKRAADGTSQKIAESYLQGKLEEKWDHRQEENLKATFLFVPQEVRLYGKNQRDLSPYQKPVMATLNSAGSLATLTFASDMSPVARGALTGLLFYRNFPRGVKVHWQGKEQSENGPIAVHYALDETTLVRTLGDPNAREGYQSSTIIYHLTSQKQVAAIDIDLSYVKIVGEFKLISTSHGTFRLAGGPQNRATSLTAVNESKRQAGSYQTVALDKSLARPAILDNPSMPRIDLQKAFNTLEEVLIRADAKEKTSFFMALSRYFGAHPEDLDEAREYLVGSDPLVAESPEKIAIVVGAMDRLISPEAEETLIALLAVPPSGLRDDIVLQSAMSLGRHLAPSTKSIPVLWQTFIDESLSAESRSAALLAMGAIAPHLGSEGALKVRRLLLPLIESANPAQVIMALSAMANHGDAVYFKVISELLRNHANESVRLGAARALSRIRLSAAAELLRDHALNDPSDQVRLACAQSLAGQNPGKKEAKMALDLYRQSADLAIKEVALEAVSLLTQEDDEPGARALLQTIYQQETIPELKSLTASYLHRIRD